MLFRQITHDDLGCASYLIGDEDAGVAAVVDPRHLDPQPPVDDLDGGAGEVDTGVPGGQPHHARGRPGVAGHVRDDDVTAVVVGDERPDARQERLDPDEQRPLDPTVRRS